MTLSAGREDGRAFALVPQKQAWRAGDRVVVHRGPCQLMTLCGLSETPGKFQGERKNLGKSKVHRGISYYPAWGQTGHGSPSPREVRASLVLTVVLPESCQYQLLCQPGQTSPCQKDPQR